MAYTVRNMAVFSLLLLAGSAEGGSAGAKVTPMEKVIELLKNLKSEVEADGAKEAGAYDEYACFCKDKTGTLSDSILAGKDNINTLSADIAQKTALKESTEEELLKTQKKEEALTQELADTKAECAAGLAAYEAANADITKAIGSLEGAIETLESAKPVSSDADKAAGLLSVRQTVKNSLMLAEAMKIVDQGPTWGKALVFIQSTDRVNPNDPEYKYHSQGIINILKDLLKTFTEKKEEADLAEKERASTCAEKTANLEKDLKLAAEAILAHQQAISDLAAGIAEARNDLLDADAALKDDQLYLKDLTEVCQERAADYDQRASMRAGELAAISKALTVLEGAPAEAKRALLLAQARKEAPAAAQVPVPVSFIQEAAVSEHKQQEAVSSRQQQREQRKNRALEMLQEAGTKLKSTALLAAAARAASGPFDKVKVLIEELIQRLIKEATEEATKKGYCDTELGKAETDRQFRYEAVMKLNSEIEALEVKADALAAEIEDLTEAIAQLEKDLATATETRAADKEVNLETIARDKEGVVAITEAIMILKSFYTEAAKATGPGGYVALLQYSPVEDDTSGPGFEGNYGGQQDAMKAIFGLLEVLKSDFDREMRKTEEQEKEAQAAFILYERDAKADISAKTTKKELDTEDLATTKSTISSKMEDMKKNMEMLDAALGELEGLKPMCIDSGMSYKERVAKREEEIEHLRTALCILDEAKVEEECKGD